MIDVITGVVEKRYFDNYCVAGSSPVCESSSSIGRANKKTLFELLPCKNYPGAVDKRYFEF